MHWCRVLHACPALASTPARLSACEAITDLSLLILPLFSVAHYPYCCNYFGSWSYRDSVGYFCTGNEATLTQCSTIFTSCYYTAGIYCSKVQLPESTPKCTERDVRLVNGSGPNEGRVEVCYNGTWSSVCNIQSSVASVICKQLGYTSSGCKEVHVCMLQLRT